eukprot:2420942-Amphidinium_carterae.1
MAIWSRMCQLDMVSQFSVVGFEVSLTCAKWSRSDVARIVLCAEVSSTQTARFIDGQTHYNDYAIAPVIRPSAQHSHKSATLSDFTSKKRAPFFFSEFVPGFYDISGFWKN